MPFRPAVSTALEAMRSVGGILGLRVFTVTVRRRVWTGGRPGAPGSTKVDTDVVLTNQMPNGTQYPVLVRQVSRGEAIASGGQYTNRDLKVGPLTPSFIPSAFTPIPGIGIPGGQNDLVFDPAPVAGVAVEMIWIVASSNGTYGIPATGIICEKKGEEATSLHTYIILRATGRAPT